MTVVEDDAHMTALYGLFGLPLEDDRIFLLLRHAHAPLHGSRTTLPYGGRHPIPRDPWVRRLSLRPRRMGSCPDSCCLSDRSSPSTLGWPPTSAVSEWSEPSRWAP